MSDVKLSLRAQAVLAWIQNQNTAELVIRQASLAEKLGCSRWSIGRALKRLKEAGLIADLEKRHESRCKMYRLRNTHPSPCPLPQGERGRLTTQAETQLRLYRYTFESVFRDWPNWERYYPQVTWGLEHVTNIDDLWRQTFDKLYVLQGV